MNDITKETIGQFISSNDIGLASTQPRLCLPIINRMYRKMSAGIQFPGIKIENNLICDGHHRYIASLLAKFQLEKLPGKTASATTAVDWRCVIFEEEDWDTNAKIKMLNEQDAAFNNMPIEQVAALLK